MFVSAWSQVSVSAWSQVCAVVAAADSRRARTVQLLKNNQNAARIILK
ncbi:hypothetical protein [Methanimicrococcus hongohii]|nr:hypothetical protein [Methanimicrococcus sp. Hf6]